jgi:hypothetical protein
MMTLAPIFLVCVPGQCLDFNSFEVRLSSLEQRVSALEARSGVQTPMPYLASAVQTYAAPAYYAQPAYQAQTYSAPAYYSTYAAPALAQYSVTPGYGFNYGSSYGYRSSFAGPSFSASFSSACPGGVCYGGGGVSRSRSVNKWW